MEKNFDAIVVGAGNGGLTAAAALAKENKKVLLIERHNSPGGAASSFTRGRFEEEVSLHEMCGVGSEEKPGGARELLRILGAEPEWVKIPDLFRVIGKFSDGSPMDVTLPSGEEEFYSALIALDEKNKKAILKLKKIGMPLFNIFSYLKEKKTGKVLSAVKYFLKYGVFPAKKAFLSIGLSQKIIDVLSTYWSYLGVDLDDLTFYHYISMLYGYVVNGVYIPSWTSSSLSYAILNSFYNSGGKALFNAEATAINVKDGKVIGVTAKGEEFFSPYVIYNGNPANAYLSLIKPTVPLSERREFTVREFSVRPFVIYLGLNKSAEELSLKDYSIFITSEATSKEELKAMESLDSDGFLISVCPSAVYAASEEGTSILTLTTLYSSDCWSTVNEEEYFSLKEKIAERLIDRFEEATGIKIKESIEEIEIATPLTFYRYTAAPLGCAYGYAMKGWDNVIARVMAKKSGKKIKGLKFCGGACEYGNGYNMAQKSGYETAQEILEEMNK